MRSGSQRGDAVAAASIFGCTGRTRSPWRRKLLARATTAEQTARIGSQAGDRVWLFLETDDLVRDHAAWLAAGVHFREAPRHEPYGKVVVFEDLYGNAWDLIEPRA